MLPNLPASFPTKLNIQSSPSPSATGATVNQQGSLFLELATGWRQLDPAAVADNALHLDPD
jgi:hypothetical protein